MNRAKWIIEISEADNYYFVFIEKNTSAGYLWHAFVSVPSPAKKQQCHDAQGLGRDNFGPAESQANIGVLKGRLILIYR